MRKTPDWLKVSAPAALLPLEGGRALRLLTETEEMQVRREAMELAANEMELPLCSNACLVARALVCAGERVYADGRTVLEVLPEREMTEEDYLWCAVQLLLDEEEAEAALCPACRAKLDEARCSVCGQETGAMVREENTGFDWERYERLKAGGSA